MKIINVIRLGLTNLSNEGAVYNERSHYVVLAESLNDIYLENSSCTRSFDKIVGFCAMPK